MLGFGLGHVLLDGIAADLETCSSGYFEASLIVLGVGEQDWSNLLDEPVRKC